MYRTQFPEKSFLCLKEDYCAFFGMFSEPDMAKDSILIICIY
jgi:hypothetical protein